ncbi:hypothetical protein GCM10027431_20850 [Lysobacter rhizosphaerae]
MNPLARYATLGCLLLTLTACHRFSGDAQMASIKIQKNPQPKQAYKISLMLVHPPGPFAYMRAVAQYNVVNEGCLPPSDSNLEGYTYSLDTDEPFALTQVSANQYEGIIHADLMRDEDYLGRGVCHWQLTEARVGLLATGADGETGFAPYISSDAIRTEQSKTLYFWKGGYPRDDFDNYTDGGETDVAKFKPELRGDLFAMVLTAKKVQP